MRYIDNRLFVTHTYNAHLQIDADLMLIVGQKHGVYLFIFLCYMY